MSIQALPENPTLPTPEIESQSLGIKTRPFETKTQPLEIKSQPLEIETQPLEITSQSTGKIATSEINSLCAHPAFS
jgi:hypothetical protein